MLPFHVASALLGIGDLHPGGAEESQRLVAALAKVSPGRALEIGGGAGLSAARLRSAGFDVTVIEPDPVLAVRLGRGGATVIRETLRDAKLAGPFDVVLAESVLYGTPLDGSLARIRELLRPGGLLAFVDMVWTAEATVEGAAEIHDRTLAEFGIAMASREPLTWEDWRFRLAARRFRILEQRRLGDGSPGHPTVTGSKFAARLRHPIAAFRLARSGRRRSPVDIPRGWHESWSCVAVRD